MIVIDTCPPRSKLLRKYTVYEGDRLHFFSGIASISCDRVKYAVYLYRDRTVQITQLVELGSDGSAYSVYLPVFGVNSLSALGERIRVLRVRDVKHLDGAVFGNVGYVYYLNRRVGYMLIPITQDSTSLLSSLRALLFSNNVVVELNGMVLSESFTRVNYRIDYAKLVHKFGAVPYGNSSRVSVRIDNNAVVGAVLYRDLNDVDIAHDNYGSAVILLIKKLNIALFIRAQTIQYDEQIKSVLEW